MTLVYITIRRIKHAGILKAWMMRPQKYQQGPLYVPNGLMTRSMTKTLKEPSMNITSEFFSFMCE